MVAGSRVENSSRPLPLTGTRAWRSAPALSLSRLATWPVLAALYVLAVAALLLPWPFAAHPTWAYNWEDYTAWRWTSFWEPSNGPTLAILALNDGLMTDSGQGPLVGLPVALGVALIGFEIDAFRLPVTLLAACSVPLLWLFGRRAVGSGPATSAALLLAVSPAFLFYGRTATLVGVSLVPLLVTALALARVVDARADARWRWRREGALAASMLLGISAYAPVRLLWPLTMAVLILAALGNRPRRNTLLGTALLCALIVPVALMALEQLTAPAPDPLAAAARYFNARGEQAMAMGEDPAAAGQYVRDASAMSVSVGESLWRLVGQNAGDLARLLLDRGTGPVPSEYWNERGRFWPWYLMPFAAAGAALGVARGLRGGVRAAARLLPLLALLALALPLLLTSRVHVGRLLPALPFALLLAASGLWLGAGWLAALWRRARIGAALSTGAIAPFLVGGVMLLMVDGARSEMATPLPPSRAARTAEALAAWSDDARERGGAMLVEDPALGDEIESVHAAGYRLSLDETYRFVDLRQARPTLSIDPRPPLYWRGVLGALQAGAISEPCDRLWFVGPEITDAFLQAWRAAGCVGAPDSVVLP